MVRRLQVCLWFGAVLLATASESNGALLPMLTLPAEPTVSSLKLASFLQNWRLQLTAHPYKTNAIGYGDDHVEFALAHLLHDTMLNKRLYSAEPAFYGPLPFLPLSPSATASSSVSSAAASIASSTAHSAMALPPGEHQFAFALLDVLWELFQNSGQERPVFESAALVRFLNRQSYCESAKRKSTNMLDLNGWRPQGNASISRDFLLSLAVMQNPGKLARVLLLSTWSTLLSSQDARIQCITWYAIMLVDAPLPKDAVFALTKDSQMLWPRRRIVYASALQSYHVDALPDDDD